jgi:hypothetical protein
MARGRKISLLAWHGPARGIIDKFERTILLGVITVEDTRRGLILRSQKLYSPARVLFRPRPGHR